MAKQLVLAGAAVCVLSAFFAFGHVQPAEALTMKECSAKYKAAQAAGTLNGLKWNDFRARECGSDAAAAPASGASAKSTSSRTSAKEDDEPPAPTMAAPRGMSFPRAVSAKYSRESPGKGRMHTCLDAYNDAKSRNALNGLTWIQKGGGYYSFCNASLKRAN